MEKGYEAIEYAIILINRVMALKIPLGTTKSITYFQLMLMSFSVFVVMAIASGRFMSDKSNEGKNGRYDRPRKGGSYK